MSPKPSFHLTLALAVIAGALSPGLGSALVPAPRFQLRKVLDRSALGSAAVPRDQPADSYQPGKYFTPVALNDAGEALLAGSTANIQDNELQQVSPSLWIRSSSVVTLRCLPGDVAAAPRQFLPDGKVFGVSFGDLLYHNGVHGRVDHPVTWGPDGIARPLPYRKTVGGDMIHLFPNGDLLLRNVTDTERRYVGKLRPVLLHTDGTYTELPLPTKSVGAAFLNCSPSGALFAALSLTKGSFALAHYSPGAAAPAVWRNLRVETLAPPPNVACASVTGINEAGAVIGNTDTGDPPGKGDTGSILWKTPNKPQMSPLLPGSSWTRLWAVNARGTAVGTSGGSNSTAGNRAVALADDRLLDLTRLTSGLAAIRLSEGLLISDSGLVLAASVKDARFDCFYLLCPQVAKDSAGLGESPANRLVRQQMPRLE